MADEPSDDERTEEAASEEAAPAESEEAEETEEAEEVEDSADADAGAEEPVDEEDDVEDLESAMTDGDGEEEDEEPDPPVIRHEGEFYGTGRRKTSVARVWIEAGDGSITVNGQPADQYFQNRPRWTHQYRGPLQELGFESDLDVRATLEGGGKTGQAGALQLGIARALVEMDENARAFLRPPGYLTRDDRQVERKKMNQPGARAKSQVSKR